MIQIFTHTNSFNPGKGKAKYCFRSVADQTLDTEDLIKEIVDYNSTLTEADVRAMLTVLNDKVTQFVKMGYKVELPFGYICNKAKGTADHVNDKFIPGNGNHCFVPEFHFKKEAVQAMTKDAAFKNAGCGYAIRPVITELYSIKSDATPIAAHSFAAGTMLRVRGRNLLLKPDDTRQGIFLVDSDHHQIRIESYHRIGTRIVEGVIPAVSAGSYEIKVVTKPGIERYEQYLFSKTVEITA